MGKYRTKIIGKGGALRASSNRKIQKRQKTKKDKQNKISRTKQSIRCQTETTTKTGGQKRPSSLKETPSTTQKLSSSVIKVRTSKSYSLEYYKGYYDHTAASFSSIAVLANGQKIIVGGEHYLLRFSPKMVRLADKSIRKKPLDVTAYNGNECIVIEKGIYSEEGLYEFYFIEPSDSSLTPTDHNIETLHDCKLIGITACNNKIYSLCDTVPPSLKLFSKTRPDPIWTRQTDEDGNELFKNPTCITGFRTKKGIRLVVADRRDNKTVNLVLLDGTSGNILRSEQALFGSVVGLTTDKHDNIFVCYNSPITISVLQNDLSNERVVYKSRNLLKNPRCLAYDETKEELLMIDDGHTLHTFKISYKCALENNCGQFK